MSDGKYDPDLDDDKALRTLVGLDAIYPESEKQMVYCGNVHCASRTVPSYDPLKRAHITGRRFYVPNVPDGELWLCPDCAAPINVKAS